MEIVIVLFVVLGGSIAFSAWMKNKSSDNSSLENHVLVTDSAGVRKCLACGHEGEMKTWLANYKTPKIITVIGFLLGYIPGLIFLGFYWGKYKCPVCGSVGKNQLTGDLS
jgi:hypothetical protein